MPKGRAREAQEADMRTACDAGASGGRDVQAADAPPGAQARSAAVFFVGNKLMLDEGVGPAAYEALRERYDVPGNVALFDVGCMSMDMLPYVRDCDVVLTVDAVDGTGEEPGTVFRFPPDAMARAAGARASLHDLKLADLFDAAALLGYEAEGYCLGMQVENMSPAEYVVGLTPKVHAALPLLVEAVAAELARRGFPLSPKADAAAHAGAQTQEVAGGPNGCGASGVRLAAGDDGPVPRFAASGAHEGADAPRNGAASGE